MCMLFCNKANYRDAWMHLKIFKSKMVQKFLLPLCKTTIYPCEKSLATFSFNEKGSISS